MLLQAELEAANKSADIVPDNMNEGEGEIEFIEVENELETPFDKE